MYRIAYLDFLVLADGLGMAGSQCIFTLEGSGLPLAVAAGWGVAACVGPLCYADRVLEGHFLCNLPHAAGGVLDHYLAYFVGGCQVGGLK